MINVVHLSNPKSVSVPILVVAGERPRVEGDRGWRHKVARRHVAPLWVEQDLEAVSTRGEIDDDDGDTRVRRVHRTVGKGGIGGEADRFGGGDSSAARGVEDLHLERLITDLEGRRSTAAVDFHGSVRVHSPHNFLGRGDIVLKEYLSPFVDGANATLERGALSLVVSNCHSVQGKRTYVSL